MILERTVYDVKCSQCWASLAYGYADRKDAQRCEDEASVDVGGERHALCPKCEESTKKNGGKAK